MSVFTSNFGLEDLRKVAKQLATWSDNPFIRVSFILTLNDIGQDCAGLYTLLTKCFDANGTDNDPDPQLSDVLTSLSKVSTRFSVEYLAKSDRLDDLVIWVTILKVLCDSFASHSAIWKRSLSPEEGHSTLLKELAKLPENNIGRTVLLQVPWLVEFMKITTVEYLYLKTVDEIIDRMQDEPHDRYVEDAKRIVDGMPGGFKYPMTIFVKMFALEMALLSFVDLAGESLEQFYVLLFFMYENSDDQDQICHRYSILNEHGGNRRCKKRDLASFRARITLCGKILKGFMSTNPNEVLHLFKWFCAFDPDSPIANLNLNAFDTQAGETDPVHVKQEEVLSIQHRRTSTRGRMGESFLKRRDEFIKSGVWEQVRKGMELPYHAVIEGEASSETPVTSNLTTEINGGSHFNGRSRGNPHRNNVYRGRTIQNS